MIHPPKSWSHRSTKARKALRRAHADDTREMKRKPPKARGINRQSVNNYLDTLKHVRYVVAQHGH